MVLTFLATNAGAQECGRQTGCPKSGGLDLMQIRSNVDKEAAVDKDADWDEADAADEEVECEVSSIAKDYYTKPPEHEFSCHIDGESDEDDMELDVDGIEDAHERFHPQTGDRITLRGRRFRRRGRKNFKAASFFFFVLNPCLVEDLQTCLSFSLAVVCLQVRGFRVRRRGRGRRASFLQAVANEGVSASVSSLCVLFGLPWDWASALQAQGQ